MMGHVDKSALADEVDRMYNYDKLCTSDVFPPLLTWWFSNTDTAMAKRHHFSTSLGCMVNTLKRNVTKVSTLF